MKTGYHFGHPIYYNEAKEDWCWKDTDEPLTVIGHYLKENVYGGKPVMFDNGGRVCPKCNKCPTPDGHDPCIENLPGVAFACCGHGVHDGYVKFENGVILRGKFEGTNT